MNPILLFTLLAFLTPISPRQPPFTIAADIVAGTCKKIAAGDPNIDYNLCRSLFDSSPGSHKADLKGLGVISIGFTKKSANHVIAVLNDLIKKNPSQSYKKNCLTQCKEQYSDSMSSLSDSAKAIASGRINDARTWLSASADVPYNCEDCFSAGKIRSPLAGEDGRYIKVVTIPLAIAALLDN